jgi:hypothetical protein
MKPSIALALLTSLTGGLQAASSVAAVCEARSGARPMQVVELYTSEGCSSCPPADRWLSTLKGQPNLLPIAFHVNYWNRLGWADRFASTEATERQYLLARTMGAPNVYTPQVIVQGQDWRRWPTLPVPPASAPMTLSLQRDGLRAKASVGAAGGRWAGYWAVLESGHRSRVTAGENHGETLRHDHVVRHYRPVEPWTDGARVLSFDVPPPEPGATQRVAFVVVDAISLRPVQALALDC